MLLHSREATASGLWAQSGPSSVPQLGEGPSMPAMASSHRSSASAPYSSARRRIISALRSPVAFRSSSFNMSMASYRRARTMARAASLRSSATAWSLSTLRVARWPRSASSSPACAWAARLRPKPSNKKRDRGRRANAWRDIGPPVATGRESRARHRQEGLGSDGRARRAAACRPWTALGRPGSARVDVSLTRRGGARGPSATVRYPLGWYQMGEDQARCCTVSCTLPSSQRGGRASSA